MKNSGIPLSSFSPKVQALIRAADRGALPPHGSHPLQEPHNDTAAGAPMLRQRQGPALNKTEAAWQAELAHRYPDRPARAQAVTLLLGNGVRYTPDFFLDPVIADRGGDGPPLKARAFEVKGFMRDDAAVKLKVAASLHPWIEFFLVSRKGRAHPWRIQEILP